MAALPLIIASAISLLVALIAFPRKSAWNLKGILFAALISSFLLIGLSQLKNLENPKRIIHIVDENGNSLPNVSVKFTTLNFDESKIVGIKITDKNGNVAINLPTEGWSAEAAFIDGQKAGIHMRRPRDSADPDELALNYWWVQKKYCSNGFTITGHFQQQRNFEIRYFSNKKTFIPWLQEKTHKELLDILNGKQNVYAIEDIGITFNEIPLIFKIAEKPQYRDEAMSELSGIAQLIKSRYEDVWEKEHHINDGHDPHPFYADACEWFGYKNDDSLVPSIAPQVRIKLQGIANQLLDSAKPYWNTPRHEAIFIYQSLGVLAKPAVPDLIAFLRTSPDFESQYSWYSGMLENSQPDISQVRPLFDDANPLISVIAINSVKDRLSPEDATFALKKLQAISATKPKQLVQWVINEAIPELQKRISRAGK